MAGYLGNTQKISGSYTVDEFTSSGGTTYTLTKTPGAKNNIQVSAGGLVQYPSAYSVSGTTLTLSGVPSGQKVVVRHMGDTIPYPTLAADAVDGTKLADNAVDSEHYTDGSIDNIHTNFQPGTTFKGDGSSARGKIVLNCEMNTHGVSIQSPAHSAGASYTLTLPTSDGAASEVLTTDGSGVLSWAAGGGSTVSSNAAMAKMNADQTLTTDTITKITFDTEIYDVGNNFDSSTNYRYTVGSGEAGKHLILASINGSPSDQKRVRIYLYKNGSDLRPPGYNSNIASVSGGHYLTVNLIGVIELADNDYLEIFGAHNEGGNLAFQAFNAHFTVVRLD